MTFDWADGGDIWQDVHPHDNEEVLMEQCKRVKALGTGATTDRNPRFLLNQSLA